MPDLSLLEPLSVELGITLNELLSGEKIENEKVIEQVETSLINAIDYSNQKIEREHNKISIGLMIIGIIISMSALTIFESESSWCSVYSIIYNNLFYNVYRINADTENEYYIIDTKKEYTIDTISLSPFN